MSSTLVETAANAIDKTTATLHLNVQPTCENYKESKKSPWPEQDYKYARFLPTYDRETKYPPLEPFEHVDPGHAALKDPNPQSFLEGAKVTTLTPVIGSEVDGIQLSKLNEREKR